MRTSALVLAALALAARVHCADSASMTVLTRHADSGCATTPQQVALSVSSSCSSASTLACASSGSSANSYYAKQTCTPAMTTATSMSGATKALFASSASPYVLLEVYASGKSCSSDSLVSAFAFLADAKCLVVDNGDSSMTASVTTDGSAVLTTYSGASCSGSPVKMNTIASGDTAGKTCVNGALKLYTSEVATTSTPSGTSSSAGGTARRAPLSGHMPTAASVVMLLAAMALL